MPRAKEIFLIAILARDIGLSVPI